MPHRSARARFALPLAIALLATGCRLDVVRYRLGSPIDRESYAKLEVDRSTLDDAVSVLGAPEKVEWKSGSREDYLWYLYQDSLGTGLRFQFPPFRSVFGYQHTFLRLSEDSDDVNALQLVFDEDGILRRKSLRLSEAYQPTTPETRTWRIQATGLGDRSLAFLGDGGFADWDEIFGQGYRAGVDVGYQPVPIVAIVAGGNWQEYPGQTVRQGTRTIAVDDLELAQAQIGFRFSVPLSIFLALADFDELKRLAFETDPRRAGGLRLFVRTTTGATLSNDVGAAIVDPAPAPPVVGNAYDRAILLGADVSAGLEFRWSWGAVSAGATYQRLDALDAGNVPLDTEGDAFESFLVGGSLGIVF